MSRTALFRGRTGSISFRVAPLLSVRISSVGSISWPAAYTSCELSGDHCAGAVIKGVNGNETTFRTDPPTPGITKEPPPSRVEKNAIHWPSGDQLGKISLAGLSEVRLMASLVPTWVTQISQLSA